MTSSATSSFCANAARLNPKVQLYIDLWRLHRRLPPAFRFMGNQYLRDEWARHRNVEGEVEQKFVQAWVQYKGTLEEQLRIDAERKPVKFGRALSKDEMEALSNHQLGQLHALRQEAKSSGTPPMESN